MFYVFDFNERSFNRMTCCFGCSMRTVHIAAKICVTAPMILPMYVCDEYNDKSDQQTECVPYVKCKC